MKVILPSQQIIANTHNSIGADKNVDKGVSFSDYLNGALKQVSDLQNESDQLNQDLALGKTDNIQQVMIAGEKADLAMQFTVQVRNKILDAYNEIMRMSV